MACLEELGEISARVWASPVQSKTDILERALIAHYWCAEGPNHELVWDEADGRDQAIFHLITSVLDHGAPA